MANEKKYFTIAEVSALTNLPAHKIRYLEKSSKFLPLVNVRGRRYYTKECINYLKQNFPTILQTSPDSKVDIIDNLVKTESVLSNFPLTGSKAKSIEQLNLDTQPLRVVSNNFEQSLPIISFESTEHLPEEAHADKQILSRIDLLLGKLYRLLGEHSH